MPSADTETPEAGAGTTDAGSEAVADEGRSALLEALTTELGDSLVDSHLLPGKDLWIRVATEAWASTADYLRNRQRFRFFDFLSAIFAQRYVERSLHATLLVVLGCSGANQ